ncbi:GSCFA domain-containing protein [Sphingobium phenoxybenzoativorans]|uniref:GSCFA domain-containing protein n=1 Tax=Sphingobium phenoxybenzoativorans TaxID=1592790 RepID=UPI0008729ADF|nr:GSCFA domain-containing protein [Sphingobium phenoxybenzoativorans]
MVDHPYKTLPDKAFWRRAVAAPDIRDVDPVGVFDVKIKPKTKVATAGSCFAQHIARYLKKSGFSYYVAEKGHPVLPEAIKEINNYGLFSARYGNIYTARQLLQLFKRAYGLFEPREDVWIEAPDVVLDPFRPTTQPGGFVSEAEMRADRSQHLAAVRSMFETMDVFVFTLGLTECWRSKTDGAVFPICPGVEGGKFNPSQHEFYNQTVEDVISDMSEFIEALKKINRSAQIILTVSPVPLMATAELGSHVLSATTYSKSVLRVSAESLRKRFTHVHYFPSFEIITGAYNRGGYYAPDLRNVLEDGVAHVMGLFMKHAAGAVSPQQTVQRNQTKDADDYLARAGHLVEVECDETALDPDKS